MGQEIVPSDRAVHSDFLVHWTGKDIDLELEPGWFEERHHSRTNREATDRYASRLRDILKFGLWMTEDGLSPNFKCGGTTIEVPKTPMLCFTELKLSESRRHASLYGRLGIGVKRPFLFHRFGRPLAYVGFSQDNHHDKFLQACAAELSDKRMLNYFKPMNADYHALKYELYSESEWRILAFDELIAARKIVDPRDPKNSEEHAYFSGLQPEQQEKLKFLVPLDGWFSMIIYPSLEVKNAAQWADSNGIRDEIKRIKSRDDHGNRVERRGGDALGNWPIEVNLDACAHF